MAAFIIAVLALLATAVAIVFIITCVRNKKALNKIRLNWGKKPEREYRDTDMESISSYYRNSCRKYSGIATVDDITWNDLDMDNVYKELNRTLSTVGEEILYAMLRRPESDTGILEERNRLVEHFRSNVNDRESIQMELYKLGVERRIDVTDFLFDVRRPSIGKKSAYMLLASLSAVALLLIATGVYAAGISLMFIMFMINMTVTNRQRRLAEGGLYALGYMVSMISCGIRMCKKDTNGIDKYKNSLYAHCMKVKRAAKSAANILMKADNPLLEYINVLFMIELISFESSFKKLISFKEDVLEIHRVIGLIDSCISIASYRESLDSWCFPDIKRMKKGSACIKAEAIYHPLLINPVVNNAFIAKPLLVTGSNASGKSTFLKTIAINAIFAQTIATCLSGKYKSAMFMIFSSMALKDSLEHQESYYIAEVKSLKRIVEHTDEDLPVLCVIDEVLRGTNTVERIAASSQVLSYLAGEKVLCIAATHDLELSEILARSYENCHFQEKYSGSDIVFDYLLYPGKSTTRNAIKLLRIMGFPESVVNQAEERAERFVKDGKWSY